MAQTFTKTKDPNSGSRSRPVTARTKRSTLAGGICAVALLVSSESEADFQVDTRYHPDGRTTVVRRIKPLNFAIAGTPDGPAPGNACPGRAFEILNPGDWESACIGYVTPRRHR